MSVPPQASSGSATPPQASAGFQTPPQAPAGSETPPNLVSGSNAVRENTPLSNRQASGNTYSSTHSAMLHVHRVLGREMNNCWMKTETSVILEMLPSPEVRPLVDFSLARLCAEQTDETKMYDPFIVAFQGCLHPSFVLVNTSSHTDPATRSLPGGASIKPGMSMYHGGRRPPADKLTSAALMENCAAFKVNENDEPFQDGTGPFERNTESALATRGQIISYVNAVQAFQTRTRVFTFFILGKHCRLICHSRGGTQVSPRFDYTKEDYLHEFFWRYSHATPAERGHDDTIERVHGQLESIRSSLSLSASDPLYRICVEGKHFYVSLPFTRAHIYPIGRGTRCYRAYDAKEKQVVLLKDSWRIHDYSPEGEVYEKLKKGGVSNIVGVVACGDVAPVNPLHRCGSDAHGFRILIHYRIVLDTVGRPLDSFTSTWQFVTAVKDALIAHRDAYAYSEENGVIHGDISFGNIILGPKGGLLIDWELSKPRGQKDARAYERKGTRQFMSCRLLADPNIRHELRDDLESFVHVLVWTACRHAQNTMAPDIQASILKTFDADDEGFSKARNVMSGRAVEDLALCTSQLHSVLEDVMKPLTATLRDRKDDERLLTHDWLIARLEEALKDPDWANLKDGTVR